MRTDEELMYFMERYLLDELHCTSDEIGKFTRLKNTIYINPYAIWIIPTAVKSYLNIPEASDKRQEMALRMINQMPDFEELYRIDMTKTEVGRAVKYKSIDFEVWLNKEIVSAFCGEINQNHLWHDYSFYTPSKDSLVYVLDDDKNLRGIFIPMYDLLVGSIGEN